MKFQVGDLVQIAIPENQETKHGRAGVRNKDIGKVLNIRANGNLNISWITGTYDEEHGVGWTGNPKEMKHASMSNRLAVFMLQRD